MQINDKIIIDTATSYLNHPYSKEFDCVKFVRKVYQTSGIIIPKLDPSPPPLEFNIQKEQLKNPPIGHIMFLKDREDPRKHRAWTHIVIINSKKSCIHCSLFFGRKVVITPLEEIFKKYDFVESVYT
jgi:hypothetical protein